MGPVGWLAVLDEADLGVGFPIDCIYVHVYIHIYIYVRNGYVHRCVMDTSIDTHIHMYMYTVDRSYA